MKPSTFICGWASLPTIQPSIYNDPSAAVPLFLLVTRSSSPAQAKAAKIALFYIYCVMVYAHMMRSR